MKFDLVSENADDIVTPQWSMCTLGYGAMVNDQPDPLNLFSAMQPE